MEKGSKKQSTLLNTKSILAAHAAHVDYWINAPKEEVRGFLEENTNTKDYDKKKRKIMRMIQKKNQ